MHVSSAENRTCRRHRPNAPAHAQFYRRVTDSKGAQRVLVGSGIEEAFSSGLQALSDWQAARWQRERRLAPSRPAAPPPAAQALVRRRSARPWLWGSGRPRAVHRCAWAGWCSGSPRPAGYRPAGDTRELATTPARRTTVACRGLPGGHRPVPLQYRGKSFTAATTSVPAARNTSANWQRIKVAAPVENTRIAHHSFCGTSHRRTSRLPTQ